MRILEMKEEFIMRYAYKKLGNVAIWTISICTVITMAVIIMDHIKVTAKRDNSSAVAVVETPNSAYAEPQQTNEYVLSEISTEWTGTNSVTISYTASIPCQNNGYTTYDKVGADGTPIMFYGEVKKLSDDKSFHYSANIPAITDDTSQFFLAYCISDDGKVVGKKRVVVAPAF